MKKSLKGELVLDTSILIEIALATSTGKKLIDDIINGGIKPYTTSLNIMEALYILCRLLSIDEARKRIDLMKDSGYFEIVNSNEILLEAAECKCLFPISIPTATRLHLLKNMDSQHYSTSWRRNSFQ